MDISYQSGTIKVYNELIPNHLFSFLTFALEIAYMLGHSSTNPHFDTHINIKRDHLMSSVLIEKNELVNGRII